MLVITVLKLSHKSGVYKTGPSQLLSKLYEEPPAVVVKVTTGMEGFLSSKACQKSQDCTIFHPVADLADLEKDLPVKSVRNIMDVSTQYPHLQDNHLGVLTKRGIGTNHDSGNQDRAFVLYPFLIDEFNSERNKNDFLLSIMDGHGAQGNQVRMVPPQLYHTLCLIVFAK